MGMTAMQPKALSGPKKRIVGDRPQSPIVLGHIRIDGARGTSQFFQMNISQQPINCFFSRSSLRQS
jgi:hypothetical protein